MGGVFLDPEHIASVEFLAFLANERCEEGVGVETRYVAPPSSYLLDIQGLGSLSLSLSLSFQLPKDTRDKTGRSGTLCLTLCRTSFVTTKSLSLKGRSQRGESP
jgi:hypothetical protein